MLKPELDVGLELYHQRETKPWVQWNIEKVTSHIEVEDAPNEFFWGCNTFVDELATRARRFYNVEALKRVEQYVFPGAVAGCKIDGRIENNNLYTVIMEHIQGNELKWFLMEKYGWSEKIFFDIAWSAHQRELSKYPRLKRSTLIKYIHGWLATNRRRSREGVLQDSLCPLCGNEETKYHMFECTNPRYQGIRQMCFKRVLQEIADVTASGCCQVFQVGLSTVLGNPHPSEQTQEEWPSHVRRVYQAQSDIGWNQVLCGRISKQWTHISNKVDIVQRQGVDVWTGKVIRICWRFGLEIWKIRNELVHGADGKISILEEQRVKRLLELIYQCKAANYMGDEWPDFPEAVTEVLQWSYESQITLLDRFRYLYPEVMKQLCKTPEASTKYGYG